ncbi:unnamed protein product [Dovyalis caffra]|uniref:Beta-galactosidase n=1 Tax=Dovyalis caffra TaxID=77055 RepID=A0AAV1RLA5_9ROSI|nr:unnamed protein product [Dovyalis caffra]
MQMRKRGKDEEEEDEEEEDEEEQEGAESDDSFPPQKKARVVVGREVGGKGGGKEKKGGWGNSIRMLTQAMLKFGEAYEQAESAKLQQVVEMEKTRMKFAKELELQRMQFFMQTQMEISQLKNGRKGANASENTKTKELPIEDSVTYDNRGIIIDGKHRVLVSGSIHYPRSTAQMWPELIKKSKEGGLDAIETYVFWNAHEPARRQYDFSGNLDIIRFLKTIQEEGLYAVLRIGPYVCAEWNYGGFPVWLHNMPGIQMRTANDVFMDEMKNFTTLIVDMVKKENLFASQGGPVILAQIENEFGNVESSYGDEGKAYIEWCANMAQSLHIGIPWLMCQQEDAPEPMINTCNGWYCDQFTPNRPTAPKMWTENWTGWFKSWGGKDPLRTAEDLSFAVARFYQLGGTFQNYYMYHGGTNFGRTAGGPYITTSYDYDAPLDEYGNLNQPKWGHLKQLHDALHSMEDTLTRGNISSVDFGDSVSGTIYSTESGSSCFLANADQSNDRTINFQGNDYHVPAWSVSILPDCQNVVYNTAKVSTQTSVMVKKPNAAEEEPAALTWSWRPESNDKSILFGKGDVTINRILDQKEAANDLSDYLFYMTSVHLKEDDPIWGDNMTLRVNGTGQILHNYGPFFDLAEAGVPGPVELVGYHGDETVIKDLSTHKWSYKVGLEGLNQKLYSSESPLSSKWQQDSYPTNKMFTWYKTTFKAPLGTDPVALDLLGMGKGLAWVNGNSIGRYWPSYIAEDGCSLDTCDYRGSYDNNKCVYNCGNPTQRWYHVPRSFFNENGDNTLVLFEEFGGDPSSVNFQTVAIGSACIKAEEKNKIELSCQGRPISAIKFASFGNPLGRCGSFANGTCEASNDALSIACVGQESCTIDVSEDTFGPTTCGDDVIKTLAVEAARSLSSAAIRKNGVTGPKRNVTYDNRGIIIDGKHRVLVSGSIHYPRSTTQMWPELIKKSKEGGLDAIETYVFWNAHEPARRQYDFSGNLDLVRFLKTIQDEGLYAVLRIGPYVCAEWNYGGFPVWLHSMPGIEMRTDNDVFKNEMQNFTTLIVDMMKQEKLFASQGGPIILAQIENEYGNIMKDYGDAGKSYMHWCANMAQSLDIGVPWIMCQQEDAPETMINTCNGWYCDGFSPSRSDVPKMWTENWTGWFKNWGGKDQHRTAEDLAFAVARFYELGGTFQNYYMYHGGTNFGRSAGGPYIATSYDYDAPLDEYGNLNQPKWGHLKQLHDILHSMEDTLTTGKTTVNFQGINYTIPAWSVSILPDCQNVVYNTAKVSTQTSVMVKKANVAEDEPASFEWSWRPEINDKSILFGRGDVTIDQLIDQKDAANDLSDYLFYVTSLHLQKDDPIWSHNMTLRVKTHGQILHAFVNGKLIGSQWSKNGGQKFVFEQKVKLHHEKNIISLLSGTVGFTNYGTKFDLVPSGITGPVELIGHHGDERIVKDLSSHKWSYKVGLEGLQQRLYDLQSSSAFKWKQYNYPINRTLTWYKTTFKAPTGTDPVVVDLLGMGKGLAWVNGNNIGRYWPSFIAEDGCNLEPCDYRGSYNNNKCVSNCGNPTQRWYHVPRSFLNDEGDNTLVLFEEFGGNPSWVNFQTVAIGSACIKAEEKNKIELSCQGRPISEIKFASFGNPEGSCGSFQKGYCEEANDALSIVQKACVGHESCTIDISEDAFGSTTCGDDVSKTLALFDESYAGRNLFTSELCSYMAWLSAI